MFFISRLLLSAETGGGRGSDLGVRREGGLGRADGLMFIDLTVPSSTWFVFSE